MSDPLRIVLVGAGRIARDHVRAIDVTEGAELVAVVDPAEGAARTLAGDRDVVVADGLTAALAAADASAAVIAAPTAEHVRLGLAALDAGLHVLVEKPVAPDRAGLERLVQAGADRGRVVVSGQVLRFLPTVAAAREVIAGGGLGALEQAVERRFEHRVIDPAWPADLLLHHWGSHSLDLVLHLFSERLASVLCRGGPGSVSLLGELQGGGSVSIAQSFSSRIPRHELLLVGDRGTLEFDGYRSVSVDGEVLVEAPEEEILAAGFEAQLADFVSAARDGRPARAAAASVRPCVSALEAASRSLQTGRLAVVEA